MDEQLLETRTILPGSTSSTRWPPRSFDRTSASKGRTVAEQLAHLHNVRLTWLQSAAPDL